MANVTITAQSTATLILVNLHHPGNTPPATDLGYNMPNNEVLAGGLYHVSLAATGQVPGTEVSVTFATASSSKTRSRRIAPNGTIAALVPFRLDGEVVR